MAIKGAAALPAPNQESRGAHCLGLFGRDQHAAREAGAVWAIPGRGEQGRNQPRLAQGKGRLGRLGGVRLGRRRHRPSDFGGHRY